MHSPHVTRSNSYYDYDVRKVAVSRVALEQVLELVVWWGGLMAVLIIAALLVL